MAIYKTEDLNLVEFEAENTCPLEGSTSVLV